MNLRRQLLVLAALAVSAYFGGAATTAQAAYYQGYSSWGHHRSYGYHYAKYYYRPAKVIRYHYCIYYPKYPKYVYYYNTYTNQYWGRYDLSAKGYSLLAEKDRKEKLSDIPESAFPTPGEMPPVPETDGSERIAPPPAPPSVEGAPKGAPVVPAPKGPAPAPKGPAPAPAPGPAPK